MSEVSGGATATRPERRSWPEWLALGLAAVYLAAGCWAMWDASPKVLYADPWRFAIGWLERPFPDNVVVPDNGHVEIWPSLVRLLDLHLADGAQWVQLGVGAALALGLLVFTGELVRRHARSSASFAAIVIAVFWLGNARKLAHGNEIVPLFSILLLVILGMCAVVRGRVLAVVLCGLLATFTFGSGLASFGAFLIAAWLMQWPWSRWLGLLGSWIGTALLLQWVAGGQADVPLLAPLEQLGDLLRWLGAPFVWVLSPLLDPDHAARLPIGWARALCGAIAEPLHAVFGPAQLARWPAMAFGALGVLALLWRSYVHRRRSGTGVERLALGLGWYALGVGGLVVALRVTYFRDRPDQLYASRYLPWSMLLWLGLLLVAVERARTRARGAWIVVAAGLLLLPSQVWLGRYALKLQSTAEHTALGVAVGVLDPQFDLVESMWVDIDAVVPLLRAAETSVFAWSETRVLGTRPGGERLQPLPIAAVVVEAVANRFGAPGSSVQFDADAAADRLLLLDAAGTAIGLARRDRLLGRWWGWLRGSVAPAELRAAALR
ncbi:MAG: hypothetical protein MUC36_12290 [Planctomycetes bacterium]|jgi:hypothetical protein|nr:hypothetical protein [Planctomycetota bacterium]